MLPIDLQPYAWPMGADGLVPRTGRRDALDSVHGHPTFDPRPGYNQNREDYA